MICSNDLADVTIRVTDLISEALVLLNKSKRKILVCIDEQGIVRGVIADGDVRRGFLSGLTLADSVVHIMNSDPIVLHHGCSAVDVAGVFNKHDLVAIPIVKDGRLTGVAERADLLNADSSFDNRVVIMAGGFGKRLRPLTDDCPKPMLTLNDRPVLELLIRQLRSCGFYRLVISTHYLASQITSYFGDGSAYGVSIDYVHEVTPLGTGGALGLISDLFEFDAPLLVVNADIVTTLDFGAVVSRHISEGFDATICTRQYSYGVPYGIVECESGLVTKVTEKPVFTHDINTGIYVLNSNLVGSIPRNVKFDLPDLIQSVMAKGGIVGTCPIHEYWLDIGKPDDFAQAAVDVVDLGIE